MSPLTGTYIQEKPSFERFAEIALILFDAVARIKGQKNPRRPRLGWRQSIVTVGEAIDVSQRGTAYRQNRQDAKQAVAQLTQDLQTALKVMIVLKSWLCIFQYSQVSFFYLYFGRQNPFFPVRLISKA